MAITKVGAYKIAAKKRGMSLDEYLQRITDEKWCSKGQHWEPRANFNVDNSRGDGLTTNCHTCTRVTNPYATLKGRVSTFKGKTHRDHAKQIISQKMKGRKLRLGKKQTIETRRKISNIVRVKAIRGNLCHSFKDGKTAERRGQRLSLEYKRWRFDVFCRDKFTCQECGDARGGNLNAHHIKSFAEYPDLRLDVDNGITLCMCCHKTKH